MNDSQRFNQELELMLNQAKHPSWEAYPEEEQADLKFAYLLARADFSTQSQIRQPLRHKLLQAQREPTRQKRSNLFPELRRPGLVWLALAVILVILLFSPLGSTLAQTGTQLIESWLVGENTVVQTIEGDFVANPGEDGQTIIQPAPDSSPEVSVEESSQVDTSLPASKFETAQAQVDFKLLQPAALPEGFAFTSFNVGSPSQVELMFENNTEQRFIGLLATAVGGDKGNVTISASNDIERSLVFVNEVEAVWLQGDGEGHLIWESEGVNYQIMGTNKLEEALLIANSLQ